MIAAPLLSWLEQNQAALLWEFEVLSGRLGNHDPLIKRSSPAEPVDQPSAIDQLTTIFGLSIFERELLLLCAGIEMDPALEERCHAQMAPGQRGLVTFSLAMRHLSFPHWSALAPSSPLRRYHLLELEGTRGLTSVPLHIDERILHFLAGVNQLDTRLECILHQCPGGRTLACEHQQLFHELSGRFSGDAFPTDFGLHLFGDDPLAQEAIAADLAKVAGCELFILRLEDTPAAGSELDLFLALWSREASLLPACLLLQWSGENPHNAVRQLAERLPAPLLIASREPIRLRRSFESYEVNKAAPAAQRQLWEQALGHAAGPLNDTVDQVAEQFRLSAENILTLGQHVLQRESRPEAMAQRLWETCRSMSRPRLETLAQRIIPACTWDDLILPESQMQMLRQLASQSRHRMTVYERWGFASKGKRGLGLSALFAGPSGTGKTLAAEILAADLKLDLYRIDLSCVISKYIGETEKNLKEVFDAAETGGVLLLFDEADALFAKRSENRDGLDHFANIEVGFLLQRMESFQGLAILTTNIKSALDKAFQRRLRFVIDFPFPDAVQREAMWLRAFPSRTPTDKLDAARLANLNMAGGNIRNIALNAAFLAAAEACPVRMEHVLQATQLEAIKIERPLAGAEIRGWI